MNKNRVICIYGDQKWQLRVDADMYMDELQEYMENQGFIPRGLAMKRINYNCPPSFPGIVDKDKFEFTEYNYDEGSYLSHPVVPLYGCPMANETIGDVPECMLVNFEGYSVTKI